MDKLSPYYEELVIKFLQREASDAEVKVLRQWLEEDESHRRAFAEINKTVQATITMNRFNQQKIDRAWSKMKDNIRQSEPRRKTRFLIPIDTRILQVAASIAAIVTITYVVWFFHAPVTDIKQNAIIHNNQQFNTRVDLPDGSIVWLNTNSTIEYGIDFGSSAREVTLKGEAFFDVKKHSRNFIVKTENVSIHVKGTRFNVRAYANEDDIKTTLEEGKVELQVKGNYEVYAMIPGEQITVNSSRNTITRKNVNPIEFSLWKEEVLVFDDTPLAEIVAKIEMRYKVDIIINDAVAHRERLTMKIQNETIDEVLEFIHLSSRLKYRKDKTKIFIYE